LPRIIAFLAGNGKGILGGGFFDPLSFLR